jgi:NADPH-dependent 2,4-dienoyl-CoA reductase/sulfur reductase-like enzyme
VRIVVIGGVAAGMSAASQAKRRLPSAEVIALEQGDDVSYGACGLPYNLADPARSIDDLRVISAQTFRQERGIDLRTQHTVEAIDARKQTLSVRDLRAGRSYQLSYDALVIATGAEAVRPKLPGVDLEGVFSLRTLADGASLKRYLDQKEVARALLVGAGYIGMEMAEALTARGIAVRVLEQAQQVLPGFVREIAKLVADELARQGVALSLASKLQAIERRGAQLIVRTEQGEHEAELVLISIGVRPSVALAEAAGLQLGQTGAIAVDDHQRTNLAHVFAAGDCAEAFHRVSGKPSFVPLGTTANKQGKIAGANAAGADERFAGIVGSAAFKVFDLEVGRTGLGRAELDKIGMRATRTLSTHLDHAPSFSPANKLTSVLFTDPGSGKLLGAQMVGDGVVGKRIDVYATALYAGLSVQDVADLDLTYAPPIAPVYDPVLIAASVAEKQLEKG